MLNLVLYQPDIPQNLGACLRLSACFGCALHVIEPCGFPMDNAKLRRAGMDYIQHATMIRHRSWETFGDYRTQQDNGNFVGVAGPRSGRLAASAAKGSKPPSRLILLETDGAVTYTTWKFESTDYVMLGRESAGTPRDLYTQMDATLKIPMRAGLRSLNVAMAAGMLVAEAARQQEWRFA